MTHKSHAYGLVSQTVSSIVQFGPVRGKWKRQVWERTLFTQVSLFLQLKKHNDRSRQIIFPKIQLDMRNKNLSQVQRIFLKLDDLYIRRNEWRWRFTLNTDF